MYEFCYKYVGTKCYDRSKLVFTDTENLLNEIETDDVYEDFYENKNLFDFSDYPRKVFWFCK